VSFCFLHAVHGEVNQRDVVGASIRDVHTNGGGLGRMRTKVEERRGKFRRMWTYTLHNVALSADFKTWWNCTEKLCSWVWQWHWLNAAAVFQWWPVCRIHCAVQCWQ